MRRAFTLVEIVVALSVILVLAAVALPNLAGYLDQRRVESTATQLAAVSLALFNPAAGAVTFRQRVGANAGRLSELDSVIIANNATYATGTDNSCGNTFTNGQRNNWLNNGPFMTYNSERATGMMTPIGLAEDTLTRVGNNPPSLRLNFLSVALDDARMLDELVDGTTNGWNVGVVQWTPQNGVGGFVTMYYFVTINNTC